MSPFLPVPFSEAAAEVPEAPIWLIDRFLVKGSVGIVAGDPKTGKSEFTYQAAVAVAEGLPFLGRTTQLGNVLIIVAEEMNDDAIRRIQHFGYEGATPERVWLWTESACDTSADRPKLRAFVSEHNIALLLIDTLSSYLMLADEINNSQVTLRMKPYVDLAHQTATTVVFIHHHRKSRDEAEGAADIRTVRGGSAVPALADQIYQLHMAPGGGTRRSLTIKSRYRDIPRSILLDYPDWPDGRYISLGTPEEHTRAAQRDKVVAVLPTTGPGLSVKEVMAKTGMNDKAVRTALEDACQIAKSAQRFGAGVKKDPHRYLRIDTSQAGRPDPVPEPGEDDDLQC